MSGVSNFLIIVDTREHGPVANSVLKWPHSKRMYLDGGDFWIVGNDKTIICERSTFTDFIGKIKSNRLYKQIEKCLALSDDVYLLLENPHGMRYSKMPRKSVYSMMTAVSEKVNVLVAQNAGDTLHCISYLNKKYGEDMVSRQIVTRVAKKNATPLEQARYVLSGIAGLGSIRAESLLADKSIVDICNMQTDEINSYVKNATVAKTVHDVLRAK